MPDTWERITEAIRHVERRIKDGKSAQVGMNNLLDMLNQDWAMEEPSGYAWGALYTNYLKDASEAVVACGPSKAPGPSVATWSPSDVWIPALKVLERVGTSSSYTHRRPIVDLNEGVVTRVHVPPQITNVMKDAAETQKHAADCLWVRLDDNPFLYPVAYAIIGGGMHAYDCNNVFDDTGQLRRALQCITGGNVDGVWTPAAHRYRTMTLAKVGPPVAVHGNQWKHYNRHSDVLSMNPPGTKVHNGVEFKWTPGAGLWMAQGGTLAHGLTVLACKSGVNELTEATPQVYSTVAAMYRYFTETMPRENAAELATNLYMNAINTT